MFEQTVVIKGAEEHLAVGETIRRDRGMADSLLWSIVGTDPQSIQSAEYAEQSIEIYERTLRAMGIAEQEVSSQAVDDSQLTYVNPLDLADQYANVPERH